MFPISLSQFLLTVSTKTKLFSLITITPLVCCSFFANSVKVVAQTTPDSTLPNNTVVLPNGNLIDITGGTRPQNGANLFHSFDNFSVESNKTVRFIHNSGIENIINRVTGGSISNINGTIQTLIDGTLNTGNANVFLINPNGIIFGADAKLDIGGSFFASTADSIKFADGSFYSAVNPQETPLLTINVPLGLQYNNSNSGDIVVQGNGNNLSFDGDTFSTVRDNRPAGLQVPEGKTLALVGGNVNLQGGNLTAEQGRIELGSVLGVGLVKLNSKTSNASSSKTSDWNLDYNQVSNFQDINLTSGASIDVSGNGGEVQVIGDYISLRDGSAILSLTTGDSTGRTLNIKATDTLEVIGGSQDLSTSIFNDVDFGSSGNAGKIAIDTKNLIVAGGGQIRSNTSGNGNGGIVDVTAENIQLTFGSQKGPSGIFADANFSKGNGGSISIKTDNLLVEGGAAIASRSQTFSDGKAGDVNITAKDIQLVGTAFGQFPSLLSTSSFSSNADGGKIKVKTNTLKLVDGGQIESTTFKSGNLGNAGKLDIQAKQIDIVGASTTGTRSGIFAETRKETNGDGGLINIETEGLQLTDGGQISTNTFGFGNGGLINIETEGLQLTDGGEIIANAFASGNGGNLNIQAKQIDIFGASTTGSPSGIFAEIGKEATGDGGLIKIETEGLQLTDGGEISTSTFGFGNSGDLNITAKQIDIFGTSPFGLSSGIFAQVNKQAVGNGGVINIETEGLQLTDGGRITTQALGVGNGGNLEVKAEDILISGFINNFPSGLLSTTTSKQGGNVDIETKNLRITQGGQIQALTFGDGDAGYLNIKAESITISGFVDGGRSGLFTAAITDPNSENNVAVTGDGGKLTVETDKLTIRDGGTISASNFSSRNPDTPPGEGKAGDIEINARILELDSNNPQEPASITASTFAGGGGNITLNVDEISARNGSQITAETKGKGDGGSLNINSQNFKLSDSAIVSTSSQGSGNAGNIDILFERLEANQGKITATSEQTGGGKITLTATASEIFLRNNSSISTSVIDGTGGGGDINITADIIAGFEDSDITANAVEGNGGNINITTQGLFGLEFREETNEETSDITASSDFGINGTVEINDFGIDPSSGLVELPTEASDPSKQIATGCSSQDGNTFIVTGRGGIPLHPHHLINLNSTWLDTRNWSVSGKQSNSSEVITKVSDKPAIVEATGFMRNDKGEIELVASSPKVVKTGQIANCSKY